MVLFNHFQALWGHKWSQNIDQSTLETALTLWSENLAHMSNELIDRTLKKCAAQLEWPPSIAEFIRMAGEQAGIPSAREALQLAIRRDSSPLAVKIVKELGSWDLGHDTEKSLLPRVEAIIKEFRSNKTQGIENVTRPRTIDKPWS